MKKDYKKPEISQLLEDQESLLAASGPTADGIDNPGVSPTRELDDSFFDDLETNL